MCQICKKNTDPVNINLTDGIDTLTMCPNCIALAIVNKRLNFVPNYNYTCEITGESGAVRFIADKEKYVLKPDIMLRLLAHSLRPNEYRKLVENRHGEHPFAIHDDFYDVKTGIAGQPLL